MRALAYTTLAILAGLVTFGWVAFVKLFGPGGALEQTPADTAFLWVLVLLVTTSVVLYAAIPDRENR